MEFFVHIIRLFTSLILALTIVQGLFLAMIYLFIKNDKPGLSNRLFGLLLFTFSLTLGNHLINYQGFVLHHPSFYFLPIQYSLAFGPLLFFYVKSRLFPTFQFKRSDLKHFILPIVQAIVYWSVGFRDASYKDHIRQHFFSPVYGSFQDAMYIVFFFLYLYFAYRFIKFQWHEVEKHYNRHDALLVGWLKRMVKVLFILFFLHASYIITDYISYRYLGLNLNNKAIFSAFGELFFASMLFWLGLNGWFAWRRRI